jgi:hypothetical protein
MAKEKIKHSFVDSKGKQWTACSECNRGGNGRDTDKCSSGWKTKKFNGMGCFCGSAIAVALPVER